MRIGKSRIINGMLCYCPWKKNEDCEDYGNTLDHVEWIAKQLKIKHISTRTCQACQKVLDAELEEHDPYKSDITKN